MQKLGSWIVCVAAFALEQILVELWESGPPANVSLAEWIGGAYEDLDGGDQILDGGYVTLVELPRQAGESGEAVEEKISLSDRFGLWLSFYPFNQARYLEIVTAHLQRLGGMELTSDARTAALQWALGRGSRSGRTAHQFARHWVGSHQLDRR